MTLQKQDMSIEVDMHFIKTGLDTHRLIFFQKGGPNEQKNHFIVGQYSPVIPQEMWECMHQIAQECAGYFVKSESESNLPHCKTSIHSKVNSQPSTVPGSLYRIKTMSSIKCPQLSCILYKMRVINLLTHQYMIFSPQRSSEWICLRQVDI